ncbi:MAG TPA: AAC(3) family N-acetyltransferase, partial [Ktedonobacteraceae bacterium]|nr:AAC(3) family N-acetyltransferase [Ktedonobacteraceae bacterium]
MITAEDITQGLQALGLQRSSTVVVHTSLRSFGPIEGGAQAICQALLDTCGTLLLPAGTWDITGVPAPPGLLRPHNAAANAETWEEFDDALSEAEPYADDLPIDKELGMLPEIMRRTVSHLRCHHPLLSYQGFLVYPFCLESSPSNNCIASCGCAQKCLICLATFFTPIKSRSASNP